METFLWCALCVFSCAVGGGGVAAVLHHKLEASQAANAQWATSYAAMKAKLKKRKRQLLRALVKLEYGKD